MEYFSLFAELHLLQQLAFGSFFFAVLFAVCLTGFSFKGIKILKITNKNTIKFFQRFFPIFILITVFLLLLIKIFVGKSPLKTTADLSEWVGYWKITVVEKDTAFQTTLAKTSIIEVKGKKKIKFKNTGFGAVTFTYTNIDEKISGDQNYKVLSGRYNESKDINRQFELHLFDNSESFVAKIFDESTTKNSNFTIWHGTKK